MCHVSLSRRVSLNGGCQAVHVVDLRAVAMSSSAIWAADDLNRYHLPLRLR
jgi:hypothetical protein